MKKVLAAALFALSVNAFAAEPVAGEAKPAEKTAKKGKEAKPAPDAGTPAEAKPAEPAKK